MKERSKSTISKRTRNETNGTSQKRRDRGNNRIQWLMMKRKHTSKKPRNESKSTTKDNNVKKRNTNNQHQSSKPRGPPSNEALELSAELKKLSREKKWDKAIELYRDTSNDKIRDGHHACIMVDMSARCDKISVSFFFSVGFFCC